MRPAISSIISGWKSAGSRRATTRISLGDASNAEDIVQQTFLVALQKIYQLRDVHSLRRWIMQIAVNEVRMSWRSVKRHPRVSINEADDSQERAVPSLELVDGRETPFEACAREELNCILERALEKLSPRQREVFWLRDVQQLSGAEAAAILGITAGCAKTRLLRARLQLRAYLAPILSMQANVSNQSSADMKLPAVIEGRFELRNDAEDFDPPNEGGLLETHERC